MEGLEERTLLSANVGLPPMPGVPITSLMNAVSQRQVISTIPSNGDTNPYGLALVPTGVPSGGTLQAGDILVSNWNNQTMQGLGTTIDLITPAGQVSTFFHSTTVTGLDGALAVLKSGFVVVGSLPTTDGTSATVGQGSLLILDNTGKLVTTISDNQLLDGPWEMTVNDQGTTAQLFVSNVLNGTVTRINLSIPTGSTPIVESETLIASGYGHRFDPAAVVVGPSGLAYNPLNGVLYVASSDDNAVFAVGAAATRGSSAGKGVLIYQDATHLHGPIGLILAPGGDLIAANGDAQNGDPNQPSELVEFTTTGHFRGQFSLDAGQGGAFNSLVFAANGQFTLATLDDNATSLDLFTFKKGIHNLLVPRLATATPQVVSTVPSNGDGNPYGVAVVPSSFPTTGVLQPGDTLVSNFNNKAGQQGLGTTIVRITPAGQSSVFFTATTTTGFSGALGVLKAGFVVAGTVPTTDGTSATVEPGVLLILDKSGNVVTTISNSMIDGPWGLAIHDLGTTAQLFVSNVLNGTVVRINLNLSGATPSVTSTVVIGTGYGHRLDPAAVVVGPAGLVYDTANGFLYVASEDDNEIFAIGAAATRMTAVNKGLLIYHDTVHLHGPLGLVMEPDGFFITANADAQNGDANQPSELVEFTVSGVFLSQVSVDPAQGGAFELTVTPSTGGHDIVAAVDDNTNSLDIWTI